MLYLLQREKEKDFTRPLAQIKPALTNKLSSWIFPSESNQKTQPKNKQPPQTITKF